MNKKFLSLKNVVLTHANDIILKNICFDLHLGEIGCLLGSSGCGKTSLLRAIAGFEEISSGEIRLNNKIISSDNFFMKPEQRKIGMVFQDYSLFPHLNIFDNVMFGLHNLTKENAKKRALEIIDQVGLKNKIQSMPHELSGGEQQRVSLARALAPNPSLILLDEPFSNLDSELRESLSSDLRVLLKTNQTTALLVTHDQKEAFAIADSIGVLSDGYINQWDDAYSLYNNPQNETIASFIGKGSFFDGKFNHMNEIETSIGNFPCNNDRSSNYEIIKVFVRPENVSFNLSSNLKGKIIHKKYYGPDYLYTLTLPNNDELLVSSEIDFTIGEVIGFDIQSENIKFF